MLLLKSKVEITTSVVYHKDVEMSTCLEGSKMAARFNLPTATDYKFRILFSIYFITSIKISSSCPVGSGKPQLSSNTLPIKGHPRLS